MEFSRLFLKAANKFVGIIYLIFILTIGLYASYALWDNNQVYASVDFVQSELLKAKPKADAGEKGPSFEEILKINKDVKAWLTMDGTAIDYPIVEGKDNLEYLNKDVYGNFALAGSLFLDTRCEGDFTDTYSLIYGHHMEKHKMFGDLALYKEKQFFEKNKTGVLILPDDVYDLEVISCMVVTASSSEIFDPERWQGDISGLMNFVKSNSLYYRADLVEEILKSDNPRVVSLSTCSSEFTDARTIVLARMKSRKSE